jgi:hypothetical protein
VWISVQKFYKVFPQIALEVFEQRFWGVNLTNSRRVINVVHGPITTTAINNNI